MLLHCFLGLIWLMGLPTCLGSRSVHRGNTFAGRFGRFLKDRRNADSAFRNVILQNQLLHDLASFLHELDSILLSNLLFVSHFMPIFEFFVNLNDSRFYLLDSGSMLLLSILDPLLYLLEFSLCLRNVFFKLLSYF